MKKKKQLKLLQKDYQQLKQIHFSLLEKVEQVLNADTRRNPSELHDTILELRKEFGLVIDTIIEYWSIPEAIAAIEEEVKRRSNL